MAMGLAQPIDRSAYLRLGLGLAALKYAGDAALVWLATDQFWTPIDYLRSFGSLPLYQQLRQESWALPALGLWVVPFMWLGVTLTLRRALDAGLSLWLSLLFFVPYVNYVLMAVMAVAATAPVPRTEGSVETPQARSAPLLAEGFAAICSGLLLALTAVLIIVGSFRSYGSTLFVCVPVAMGALTAFQLNRRRVASLEATIGVVGLMFIAAAGTLVGVAAEGIICILMAVPLAIVFGFIGALIGRTIALAGRRDLPPATLGLLALPLALFMEPAAGRTLHEVRTSVEINATPDEVWPHVVAFRPIAEPREAIFRLGIAYPRYARIDGAGTGAVRYCVFSTGAFVEPITHWELGRRLAFDVSSSPAPLRELTMFRGVSPPHLDGYLRSRRGEFRLMPLDGGRTRLEGSTWYELEMGPEGYWQVYSDYMIHRIHVRVLEHIKAEVE